MCVIMCTNYVNYIRGRTYIGNANTRVEKHNLRSSRNKRMIVCMYAGISGRNSFKRGRTVKPRKAYFFFLFLKLSESVILVGTVQTIP